MKMEHLNMPVCPKDLIHDILDISKSGLYVPDFNILRFDLSPITYRVLNLLNRSYNVRCFWKSNASAMLIK
ncbi:hypothetical protein Y032_0099g3214 [Ancylostoma ceylanicum]|uniref:Uncharacterized protein n=1 Tax=Ancylostoma ceylanicum TaxID=53326 RepID=A0A016TJ95_9BILA|nr:hypothetical protein Y032_0099g3214 [Ancylostoma ceylanicum]